jgi:hypothetical protein
MAVGSRPILSAARMSIASWSDLHSGSFNAASGRVRELAPKCPWYASNKAVLKSEEKPRWFLECKCCSASYAFELGMFSKRKSADEG